MLLRCEASPKNAEAVTEDAVVMLPLAPVSVIGTFVSVVPAEVAFKAPEPTFRLPPNRPADVVMEEALITLPLAPVSVAATLLMLRALVSVPRPVMLPKLPAAIWALVMTPLAMWVARMTCEPRIGFG